MEDELSIHINLGTAGLQYMGQVLKLMDSWTQPQLSYWSGTELMDSWTRSQLSKGSGYEVNRQLDSVNHNCRQT